MLRVVKHSFLVLLVLAAVGRAADPPPPRTVPEVDLDRYAGLWHEIARLPNRFQNACAGEVTAAYERRADGRLTVLNRCRESDGEWRSAEGVARVVDEGSRSKLKVRFAPKFLSWLSAVWGDYWILDLADDYSWVAVGSPDRGYFWVLSRSLELDRSILAGIIDRAERQGFDLSRLIRTRQRRGDSAARALSPPG